MKEGVIILGHGSRRREANEEIKELVKKVKGDLSAILCQEAFLSFGKPNLEDAVDNLVAEGVEKIIVMPLFLVNGNHIKRDIPGKIQQLQRRYPQLKLQLAGHLGPHPTLAGLIREKIKEAGV